jgi:hypothetical protein
MTVSELARYSVALAAEFKSGKAIGLVRRHVARRDSG